MIYPADNFIHCFEQPGPALSIPIETWVFYQVVSHHYVFYLFQSGIYTNSYHPSPDIKKKIEQVGTENVFCVSMRKIFKKIVHVQNHSAIEIKLGWFGMFLKLSAAGYFSMET